MISRRIKPKHSFWNNVQTLHIFIKIYIWLVRISIFLVKVRFPFSQDLATFKFPPKSSDNVMSDSLNRFSICFKYYNIQIGLSFNLAPIFTPSDLYSGIILPLKQHFFSFFFVKKKLISF